jgi:hypothetical protein
MLKANKWCILYSFLRAGQNLNKNVTLLIYESIVEIIDFTFKYSKIPNNSHI